MYLKMEILLKADGVARKDELGGTSSIAHSLRDMAQVGSL